MDNQKEILVSERWLKSLLELAEKYDNANQQWEYGKSIINDKIHFDAVALAGYAKSAKVILDENECVSSNDDGKSRVRDSGAKVYKDLYVEKFEITGRGTVFSLDLYKNKLVSAEYINSDDIPIKVKDIIEYLGHKYRVTSIECMRKNTQLAAQIGLCAVRI